MKCKKCGDEINLVIYGLSEDLCWGCASKEEQTEAIETAIEAKYKTKLKKNKKEE